MEARNGMTAPLEGAQAADMARQIRAFKNGANWFYWIAGLSVVNTLISLFQGTLGFIFGLGITRIVDAIAALIVEDGTLPVRVIQMIALGVSVFFAGICFLFGWLANQGRSWAFIVGMFLYTLDGLLLALIHDWLSVGFHGFTLFCMFQGYAALRKLRTMVPPTAPQQAELNPGA
jgi:hypothetical protein